MFLLFMSLFLFTSVIIIELGLRTLITSWYLPPIISSATYPILFLPIRSHFHDPPLSVHIVSVAKKSCSLSKKLEKPHFPHVIILIHALSSLIMIQINYIFVVSASYFISFGFIIAYLH